MVNKLKFSSIVIIIVEVFLNLSTKNIAFFLKNLSPFA